MISARYKTMRGKVAVWLGRYEGGMLGCTLGSNIFNGWISLVSQVLILRNDCRLCTSSQSSFPRIVQGKNCMVLSDS